VAAPEIDLVVPVGRVQEHALVLVEAWDGWPRPVVQDARSVDQDVAVVEDGLARLEVLDLHIVATLLLVPVGAGDLVPRLDVPVEPVLARKVVEVGEDFLGRCIHGAPVQLGFE